MSFRGVAEESAVALVLLTPHPRHSPFAALDCLCWYAKRREPYEVLLTSSPMAPRLVVLRRVLKESGSIYLHCDPTASHYLNTL